MDLQPNQEIKKLTFFNFSKTLISTLAFTILSLILFVFYSVIITNTNNNDNNAEIKTENPVELLSSEEVEKIRNQLPVTNIELKINTSNTDIKVSTTTQKVSVSEVSTVDALEINPENVGFDEKNKLDQIKTASSSEVEKIQVLSTTAKKNISEEKMTDGMYIEGNVTLILPEFNAFEIKVNQERYKVRVEDNTVFKISDKYFRFHDLKFMDIVKISGKGYLDLKSLSASEVEVIGTLGIVPINEF